MAEHLELQLPGRRPVLAPAESPTALVAALVGAEYLDAPDLERAARRERYCLGQMLLDPEARLDPRSERSFILSLAAAGLIALSSGATPAPASPEGTL